MTTILMYSALGSVIGALMMWHTITQNNKFNMEAMESYWQTDIDYLKSLIEANERKCVCRSQELHKKISTITVVKPVGNDVMN